ncbi:MAG: hypothetical protein FJ102_20330 [Deltaproteobacteria bacterium]|nr:hypothetical protein [Deltaproteobacteria bacterium]
MGFKLAWAAVRAERLHDLCDALDLDPTLTTDDVPAPAAFSAITLGTGFGAVVDGTLTRLMRPEDIADLSRRVGPVLQMLVHEAVGVQVLGEWRDGALAWQVVHTEGRSPQRSGAVPDNVAAVLENPGTDSLARAAEALVGLRHDATTRPGVDGFRTMKHRWDAHLRHIGAREETRSLDLTDTDVSDAGLAHLAGSSHLQRLELRGTQVTTAGVAALGTLPALTSLSLWGLRVDDGIVPFLQGLPRLTRLEVQRTELTDAGVAAVARAPLESLSLSGAATSVRSLSVVAEVQTLDYLSISDAQLDQESLRALARSPSLRVLRLWNTPVADADLALLAPLAKLDRVFRDDSRLDGAALDRALGRPPPRPQGGSFWRRVAGSFRR